MSSSFEDRKKGFEAAFAQDEHLRFRAAAMRNKKLGLWVADKMGLQGDDAEAYAKTIVTADLEEPGEEDVFRKVRADLDAHDVDASDHQIRRAMTEMMEQAIIDCRKT